MTADPLTAASDGTLAPGAAPAGATAPMTNPLPDPAKGGLMLRFWRDFLRKRFGLLLMAFAMSMLEGATLGLLSAMLEPLFDDVFGMKSTGALVWVGGGILMLFVLRAVTSVLGRWLLARVNQETAADMQVTLLRHLLRLDGGFFQHNPPGTLIERVQGDTSAAQGAVQLVIVGVGRDLVSLAGLFAVAFATDWRWTLAALVGTPLLLGPAVALQRYIRRKTTQTRVQSGLRATRLDEIFHGIQQVKLNRMEDYQSNRFKTIVDTIVRAEVKSARGRATMPALVDVVTGLGFFAVLMLGGREVVAGERTTGEFMAFFTAMALTFQPIRRLSDLAGYRQIALASLERIYGLMDSQPRLTRPAASAVRPDRLPPALRFEGVSFAYDGTPVLQDLSFTAEAGRVTALVGASGAGKSTVFHLATGLADPDRGRILIGGADVRQMSLSDQRALFASVTQDPGLFDETLAENLILGRAGITPEDLQRALENAYAQEFIARMPQGLNAPAGPRGALLSGGQRQRIAIARALLSDAPVLLLDEATSALDSASEQAVGQALAQAQAGRTTLVIAHRLATVRDAHRILVMERGRLVEEGDHATLLAQGGHYARLHALQFRD